VPLSAPRSRAGCDSCTKGVPIALTLRRLHRVASPLTPAPGRACIGAGLIGPPSDPTKAGTAVNVAASTGDTYPLIAHVHARVREHPERRRVACGRGAQQLSCSRSTNESTNRNGKGKERPRDARARAKRTRVASKRNTTKKRKHPGIWNARTWVMGGPHTYCFSTYRVPSVRPIASVIRSARNPQATAQTANGFIGDLIGPWEQKPQSAGAMDMNVTGRRPEAGGPCSAIWRRLKCEVPSADCLRSPLPGGGFQTGCDQISRIAADGGRRRGAGF
jgi:hypothetical protein